MIGSYKTLKILGQGKTGKTYLAEHVVVKRKVVIKETHFISPEVREILLEEASLLWDINHWALPVVKDIFIDNEDTLFMVMRHIDGEDLHTYIHENGPLEPETVCWVTQRILSAMYYLHLIGIVHRDIKPANFVVNFSTHIATLVDFGFSKLNPDGTPDKKGYTSYFTAPEQLAGKAGIPQSDIYSLGISIIYLLGGNIKALELPVVPDALKEFIFTLVSEDPLKRPADCLELNHTLGNIREKIFNQE